MQNLKSRSSILAAAERSHRTLNILKRRAERWKKVGRLKRREDKTLNRKESKSSVTRSKCRDFSPSLESGRICLLLPCDLTLANNSHFQPNSEGTMESVSIIKSMGISISTLTSRHLSGKFPLLSYGRPVDIKQIRNRYQQRSNKAKNTARPWNSQIMEHRIHEQRERRRENASQKGISSDC